MLGRLVPIVSQPTPTEWFIAFRAETTSFWVRFLTFGHWKHVACFGYVPGADVWVFFEPGLNAIALRVVPDGAADGEISEMIDGATVVKLTVPLVRSRRRWRPLFLCTVAVAQLTGARSCALRPDRFLADCLAEGATLVARP